MTDNKQQIIAEFDKCPNCGSTRRFAESVAAEQREKGMLGEGLKFGIYQMSGPILDLRKKNKMLVETKIPNISSLVDVCLDCGNIYAVRLERGEVTLGEVLAQIAGIIPPGMI